MDSKRAKNFTEQDKNILLDIVEQFISVIGNKRTDATSVKEKNTAWEEITKLYNANCQSGPRLPKQLHYLYDTLKRKARQHIADDKVEHYKTGGGTFTPKTDNIDERFIAMVKPQLEPLRNCYDSCAEYLGDVVLDVINPSDDHLQKAPEVVTQTALEVEIQKSPGVIPQTAPIVHKVPEVVTQAVPDVHRAPEVVTPTPTCSRSAAINSDQCNGNGNVIRRKRAAECMADRIIKRKNIKDKYDHEIHEKKLKIMTTEEAVKAREEETSILVLDHMKRCHKLIENKLEIELESASLERQVKLNQLENIRIENELKTLELKIKQAQYDQLKCNIDI
ncbi:uncharacterized protein [Anabrus simplex]|uniref:uncharacterized protein n=1 Tax=Anabrus simplex TaxID=316456 RepID=UPI0035A39F0C